MTPLGMSTQRAGVTALGTDDTTVRSDRERAFVRTVISLCPSPPCTARCRISLRHCPVEWLGEPGDSRGYLGLKRGDSVVIEVNGTPLSLSDPPTTQNAFSLTQTSLVKGTRAIAVLRLRRSRKTSRYPNVSVPDRQRD